MLGVVAFRHGLESEVAMSFSGVSGVQGFRLGFRVWGSGFRVSVPGLGFRGLNAEPLPWLSLSSLLLLSWRTLLPY